MKNTGIVRKIDELGRIVIPREIRKTLNISEGDSLEIYTENQSVILKKYSYLDQNAENNKKIVNSVSTLVDANIYVTDKESILKEYPFGGKKLSEKLLNLVNERKSYVSGAKEKIFFEDESIEGYFHILPLIKDSDILGLMIMHKETEITADDKFFLKILKNIVENN